MKAPCLALSVFILFPGSAHAAAPQDVHVPPSLTCRYSVFEGQDGRLCVMRFNTSLMTQPSQGEVATALANLSKEEDAVLASVLK